MSKLEEQKYFEGDWVSFDKVSIWGIVDWEGEVRGIPL